MYLFLESVLTLSKIFSSSLYRGKMRLFILETEKIMKPRKVIVYVRRSTKKGQKHSLEAQLAQIQEFCQRNGLKIVKVFQETHTGKTTERPELEKALQYSKKLGIPIIVEEVSRIGREATSVMELIDTGRFITIEEGLNPDRYELYQEAIFAQKEREKISKRTKRGLQTAKLKGISLGNPKIRDVQHKGVEKVKENADSFALKHQQLFQLMESKSLNEQARILNESGVKTRRNGHWTAQSVKNIQERLKRLNGKDG